ncbi:hypothetical protein [Nonomuraea turcica]|uniref:hypothetical protein n=1 Tax=Nonomuraea sp. G32 TaxID=3067274 RepID=UPI00273A8548|nr:hypothetical protein [Nonomuraea sp. G32]MDP4501000.1 hypothetical protein [Nonomuraea sp. G32]
MTTILSEPVKSSISTNQAPADGIPAVLRRAAAEITALPHVMVVAGDLHHALTRASGGDYHLAQASLEALAAHLATWGVGDWVRRWSKARHRDTVAAQLHTAADAQPDTPEVAVALRRAARYASPPVNDSLAGALHQATPDRDVRLEAVEALAQTLRRHVRDLRVWDATRSRARVAAGLRNAAARVEAAGVAK